MPPPKTWVSSSPSSDFSLLNIPFGIISSPHKPTPTPAIAIGDSALDLAAFSLNNGFAKLPSIQPHLHVFTRPTLNAFASLGRTHHRAVRQYLIELLSDPGPYPEVLKDNILLRAQSFYPLSQVKCHLPMDIGDYTDFYAGRHHAFNAGVLFRGKENALQPNYYHLPVGYHGRASSVVVSGTPVRRPWGQILPPSLPSPDTAATPILAPTKVLDIELELGCLVARANELGHPIPIAEAESFIFGYVLLNDWSARDIQAWEYVPLGPFTGKNFCTSISPWVVLADALAPFRAPGLGASREELGAGEELEYLRDPASASGREGLDIDLSVTLKPAGEEAMEVTHTNARELLWSLAQMITHHTITGCNLRTGDLLGSGTISGATKESMGSFLEITSGGRDAFSTKAGKMRTYLQDGDEVVLRGRAGVEGAYVGFGECVGVVLPALRGK